MNIRGQEIKIESDPVAGLERWLVKIRHPFRLADGRLRFGLNDKLLDEAYKRHIDKLVIQFSFMEKEIMFVPLSPREIKQKKKRGEYEHKEVFFKGSGGFDIYYFVI